VSCDNFPSAPRKNIPVAVALVTEAPRVVDWAKVAVAVVAINWFNIAKLVTVALVKVASVPKIFVAVRLTVLVVVALVVDA
jgi:hypothetical protein